MPILILIGKRGSGKSTIAKLFTKKFGYFHIEMSSLLKDLRTEYNKNDLRLRKFVEFLRQTNRKEKAVSKLVDEINGRSNVIITGIRHPNELDYLFNNLKDNQFISIYIKLNILKRFLRTLNRESRNSFFEFIIEEYYSYKWKNARLMKKCDYILPNFSSKKTFEQINSRILCR